LASSAAANSAGCWLYPLAQMGYRVHVYSPDSDSPTGQIADREFVAAYDDLDAVRQFAQSV
jgi:5-(carboxyamino)imidazole ribonucleotide synthase